MKFLIFSFLWIVNAAWANPQLPPTGFCQTKTDYDATATCSDEFFMARSQTELDSYLQNFGLANGEYKRLRIKFSLTGTDQIIHSPCDISLVKNLSHTATNICLDGKKGIGVARDSVFMGEKLHVLAHDGNVVFHRSGNIMVDELEIFSSAKLHINTGTSLTITGNARLISTMGALSSRGGGIIPLRLGPGTQLTANNVSLVGSQKIYLLGRLLKAHNTLEIETIGTTASNRVKVSGGGTLEGSTITIKAGGRLNVRREVVLKAQGNLHAEASGCTVSDLATLQAGTFSGNCLNSNNVNRIPIAAIEAIPLSGTVPLTVSLSAMGSSDPDGTIQSYEWAFSDGITATGVSVQKEFTMAGAYTVILTVTDDDGAMETAEVMISAIAPMISPTASFTYTPSSGEAPLTVNFDGSASSDPDGSISSYEWIFSDGEMLTGQTVQRMFDRAGTYGVALKVTDDDGLTHQTQQFSIAVSEPNRPPVMVGDQNFMVIENNVLELTLNGATDFEGDSLAYALVNSPTSGTLENCLGGTSDLTCSFTPVTDFVGTVVFSYKANDGQRDSEMNSVVSIEVRSSNQIPLASAGADLTARSGDLVSLDGSASSDPEGTNITFLWELSSQPAGSQFRHGQYHVCLRQVLFPIKMELILQGSSSMMEKTIAYLTRSPLQ